MEYVFFNAPDVKKSGWYIVYRNNIPSEGPFPSKNEAEYFMLLQHIVDSQFEGIDEFGIILDSSVEILNDSKKYPQKTIKEFEAEQQELKNKLEVFEQRFRDNCKFVEGYIRDRFETEQQELKNKFEALKAQQNHNFHVPEGRSI